MLNVLSKPVMAVIGVIVLLVVGFMAGYTFCSKGKQEASLDQLDDDAKAVEQIREVVKWKTKEVKVYVNRIKTIQPDCTVDAAIVDSLRETYNRTARPSTD